MKKDTHYDPKLNRRVPKKEYYEANMFRRISGQATDPTITVVLGAIILLTIASLFLGAFGEYQPVHLGQ